ncbi:thiol reductant ABC exporter subunit CydD [Thalassobaculum sp. OXR-137]|uniref:thiol reductant ABC exporter subunit CydD n=1 Tax=Thalassobaculum sp. OXR-137 TaxID=3100173 RepID=UPI002AC90033|nr:thiol reductant ABC exporter subunit CydD [Thalassobaculum sp. OXR-137]WPZ36630.1 thiol reductant ABC exporter subunit CydD [Thalassobaculum sp. OXR-137]
MAWLKRLFAGQSMALSMMVAAGFLGAGVAVAQAWVIAGLIADAIGGAGIDVLWPPAILALALIVLRGGLSVAADAIGASTAFRIKQAVRGRVLAALAALGPAWLDNRASGAVTATAVDQVEALDGFVARFYPAQILAAAVPLGLLVPVFLIDLPSGGMLLAAGALTPVIMGLIGWRTGVHARSQVTAMKRANGYFLDRLQGLPTLKLFGEIGRERDRMRAVSDDLRRRTMGVLRLAFLSSTALELLSSLALALVAVHLAGSLLSGDGLALSEGLFVLILVPEIFQPLRRLGIHYHDKAAAFGAAEAILEILDAADGLPAPAESVSIHAAPQLVFEHLSLAYPGGRRVALDDVSFTVAPGEVVALVGESGSGKSTLLSILLGLRQPSSGRVLVDGVPVEGRALVPAIAWAGQRARILSASLRDNLTLGRPGASDGQLVDAVSAASLGPAIGRLPDGLDTRVGEGGRMLSAGEARRLVLARALVRDAPLVLLDEPTANLDRDSEAAVLSALRTLAKGRTVLVATHSPAVVAMADRVVRLERGRVVEDRATGASEESPNG